MVAELEDGAVERPRGVEDDISDAEASVQHRDLGLVSIYIVAVEPDLVFHLRNSLRRGSLPVEQKVSDDFERAFNSGETLSLFNLCRFYSFETLFDASYEREHQRRQRDPDGDDSY
jgi:hypothetical protein